MDITYFAETNFRNKRQKFGIKKGDRRKHTYIIGKSGMGKTTLLENMTIQDIQNGEGVGIIDPHGEYAEKMLDFVPPSRVKDVIYFNPSDLNFPVGFNPLENINPDQRHLVASGLMGVFKKIWPDVWSARMEYILNNTILALLESPDSSLLGINRMFSDKEFRKNIVAQIKDPVIKSFWIDEYAKYQQKYEQEATAAIQNKIGQFISNPIIRNIIGQPKSSFDIRKIMDEKKIFVMNLSKGKVGEDNMRLLGGMLITKLYLAAMGRVDIPEEERNDFYLYVDEFQNFATESFADILSEARKYRLNLILAHQYIAQMDEKVQDAVFGNVGTMMTFRVGAADAEILEKEFSPEFMVNDIVNLGMGTIYLKLLINGVASRPFSAATLPPLPKQEASHKEEIIKVSREQFGAEKAAVEEKIKRWYGEQAESVAQAVEAAKPKRPLYDAVCSGCGKKTQVIFQPDGKRPVFCPDCLEKARAGLPVRQAVQMPSVQKTPIKPAETFNQKPASHADRQAGEFRSSTPRPAATISLQALKPKSEKPLEKKPRKGPDLGGLKDVLNKIGK